MIRFNVKMVYFGKCIPITNIGQNGGFCQGDMDLYTGKATYLYRKGPLSLQKPNINMCMQYCVLLCCGHACINYFLWTHTILSPIFFSVASSKVDNSMITIVSSTISWKIWVNLLVAKHINAEKLFPGMQGICYDSWYSDRRQLNQRPSP